MSDIQILQLFGLALLAISISAVLDKGMLKKLFLSFADNLSVLFITGLFTLVLGCLMVLTHNMGGSLLHKLVLFIGYLAIIKGLFLLVFPGLTIKLMKWLSSKKSLFVLYPFLIFVFSLVCLYVGFLPMK